MQSEKCFNLTNNELQEADFTRKMHKYRKVLPQTTQLIKHAETVPIKKNPEVFPLLKIGVTWTGRLSHSFSGMKTHIKHG
jgi:hypothetical protein